MLQFSGEALRPHPRSLPPLGVSAPRLDTALPGWEGDILQHMKTHSAGEKKGFSTFAVSTLYFTILFK